ncbi:MAG: hypothetical protein HQ546_08105, partial [Planctomycetes bacterium]|nr:hypothetical protein [Planctomycetota bacterium]
IKALPATPEIQLVQTNAAVNMINYYGDAKNLDAARDLYDQIKALPPTPVIQQLQARALLVLCSSLKKADSQISAELLADARRMLSVLPTDSLERELLVQLLEIHESS